MTLRRTALPVVLGILVLAASVFLLTRRANSPSSEVGDQATNIAGNGRALNKQLATSNLPNGSASLTPAESELNRLEGEFYHKFPLALKYRDYANSPGIATRTEALTERFKIYTDEPRDVATRNLRTGNLNIIVEVDAAVLIRGALESDSELGQMFRTGFKARQWDWKRMLRNLDGRIGDSDAGSPVVESVEQLVTAIQKREERIVSYCRKKQEEASMPDSVREDIREFGLELLTRGVVKAYLETITPPELTEARKRVAQNPQLQYR